MKFHHLRIENLLSLYGSHDLDLEAAFGDAGLYLITGPTGAGKTTIMDAICLALFGTTSRARSIGSVKGVGEHVNSRGTGSTRVDLTFSVRRDGARQRYRATWYFWRAREKPDGAPQNPRRDLVRLDDAGEDAAVLVSSVTAKEYDAAFREVLSDLELDAFLRSVMLPQGEFAALLDAKPAEKAEILERITDASNYLRLGRIAHDRYREEKRALEDIDTQLGTLPEVGAEQLRQLEAAIEEAERRRAPLREWRDATLAHATWLRQADEHTNAITSAEDALSEATSKREHNTQLYRRLADDERVAPVREPLGRWQRAVAASGELTTRRTQAAEALAAATDARDGADARLAEATRVHDSAVAAHDGTREALTAVATGATAPNAFRPANAAAAARALQQAEDSWRACEDDASLGSRVGALRARLDPLNDAEQSRQRARAALDAARSAVSKAESNAAAATEALEAADASVEPTRKELVRASAALAALLDDGEQPADRREALQRRLDEAEERARLVTRALEAEAAVASARHEADAIDLAAPEQALGAATTALESARTTREEAARALETATAHLDEVSGQLRVVDLRIALEPGAPCPVCGGTDHPAAHERDDELAAARAAAKQAREERAAALDAAIEQHDTATQAHAAARARLASVKATHEAALAQLERAQATLAERRAALGDPTVALDTARSEAQAAVQTATSEITALRDAERASAKATAALEAAEKQLEAQRSAAEAAGRALEQARAAAAEQERNVENADAAIARAVDALRTALADAGQHTEGDAATLRAAVDAVVERASTVANAAATLLAAHEAQVRLLAESRNAAARASQDATRVHTEAETRLRGLQERLDAAIAERDAARAELDAAIADIEGVADLEDARALLLADDERRRLATQARALDDAVSTATARRDEAQRRQKEHAANAPSEDMSAYQAETLAAALAQLEDGLLRLERRIGEHTNALEEANAIIERTAAMRATREAQRVTTDEWRALNELIGVDNGKRFRDFALALSLERIIRRANARLQDLLARYALRTQRDEASGLPTLDFEIVDQFHAGQARALNTLSGGERFLVSLALALALADQQQLQLPIETLMLDEGFGTLDMDALQQAMGILHRLRDGDGRTVGLISHVEALKEQIPHQVRVIPMQEGRSRVELVSEA